MTKVWSVLLDGNREESTCSHRCVGTSPVSLADLAAGASAIGHDHCVWEGVVAAALGFSFLWMRSVDVLRNANGIGGLKCALFGGPGCVSWLVGP